MASNGIYDSQNFQRSVVPSWIKKETREVIETAVMFGWKMHISTSNSVTIISYDERKKFHFSQSGRTSKSLNQIKRDVIKFGDPDKLLLADSILGMKDRNLAEMATVLLPMAGDEGTVVDHRPALEEARQEAEKQKAERKPTPAEMPQKKAGSESEPHIVREQPMVAKAREGAGYRSRVAIERHWSDGTVDYKCVECDFTTENRLGVRGHYGSHKKGPGERPKETVKGDVPLAATYKPRKERVEALAAVIEALMAGGETNPEALALHALTWVNEQSRKGTRFAAEFEPLSPEETLERIRSLIDGGQAY